MPSTSDPYRAGHGRWTGLDTLAALCVVGTVPSILMTLDLEAGFPGGGFLFALALLSLPFLALALLARPLRSRVLRRVAGAAMLVLLALWWWAFRDAYMVPANSDPQSALIFVVMPLYGTGAAALLGVALRLLDRRMAPPGR